MKRLFHPRSLLVILSFAVMTASVTSVARADSLLLIVEAARDTTAGFRAQDLLDLERRALTWPNGVITMPDTMAWLDYENNGLAFRLDGEHLTGVGAAGRFTGQVGSYKIDTPLYLTDGQLVACLAAGRIEVDLDRIVYHPKGKRRDQRGDLLLLGGIILATTVLLRSARRRTRSA